MKKIFLLMAVATIMGCSTEEDGGTQPIDPPGGEKVPVAVDDEVTTAENTALRISGLLDNDTVFEYARVTKLDASTEEGGTVTDNRDGTYTYNPPANYVGQDSFGYTICDNASTPNCSSATVKITITAASPVAQDDAYETVEETSLTITSYLENDQLLDNATLDSFSLEGTNGTVTLENNGNFKYMPANGFVGEDSFSYTICDDDETATCSTATITITVVDEGSPAANDDTVVIAAATTEKILADLLKNDNVIDDAEITSIAFAGSQGTVVINSDGTLTYKTKTGFVGTDTFTYTLCDDDQPNPTCATATVTVEVVQSLSFNIPASLQDYYSGVVFSSNANFLYQELANLTVSQHTTILTYGQRHDYLYEADEDLNNADNVILMYTGESRYWKEYTSGSNSYSPQTFNTEHIYPQSKLTAADAVTDLHHLRASDDDINSLRLNYPFTDGSGEYKLVGGDKWFPGDEWKGDVARMVMYLNIRYGETFTKVGTLDLFLKWNAEDPVSAFELQRNGVIEGAQGNRNPFIDNPYLATLIWGGPIAQNRWQ